MSKQIKPGSFCNIRAYVAATDPQLADILDKTCTLDLLERAPRKANGITFIMPAPGHKLREECISLIESSDPKNLRKAADIMQSLIIRDFLPNAADWKKTEDIANSMFPAKKVVLKSVDGAAVTIEGPAKLVKDTKYKDASKRGNMTVWTLESGAPSLTTPDAVLTLKKAPAKGAHNSKYGGYMPSDTEMIKLRFRIAVVAENDYASALMQGKHCPCITQCAASLVQYIKGADHSAYMKIIQLLQRDESDFYILVEPHLPPGQEPLLDDSLIQGWWESGVHKCANYEDYCRELCADLDQAMPNREKLSEAVSALQGQVAQPDGVKSFYEKVCQENAINGIQFYSHGLDQYYKGRCDLRMMHDELRFTLPVQFAESTSLDTFKEVIQWIGERMHNPSKTSLFKSGDPVFKAFLNSSAFLYVPLKPEEMKERRKATTSLAVALNKNYFMAGDFASYERHRRIAEGAMKEQYDSMRALLLGNNFNQEQLAELKKLITSV